MIAVPNLGFRGMIYGLLDNWLIAVPLMTPHCCGRFFESLNRIMVTLMAEVGLPQQALTCRHK